MPHHLHFSSFCDDGKYVCAENDARGDNITDKKSNVNDNDIVDWEESRDQSNNNGKCVCT